MDEIEAFLDECRADPWFQSHPEVVDRLESVLTKPYLDSEGREMGSHLGSSLHSPQKDRRSVDRRQALAKVLQGVKR
jgi:hypothetical protein